MSFKLSDLEEGITITEQQWEEIYPQLLKLSCNFSQSLEPGMTICEVTVNPTILVPDSIDKKGEIFYQCHLDKNRKINFKYITSKLVKL